jgi:hypothetical protein
MTFERFKTGSQLFRTAPWLTLAATYVLLATNVDFAAELSWHDSQRLAQIVFLALVSVGVFVSASARPTLEIWTLLPRWIRFAVGVALTLGLASGFLAMYPRWAWLEWSHQVLVGVLTIAVAAECRLPNAARDQSLILVFYAVALISTVKAVAVYFSMLIAGPDYGMVFTVEDLFTGFSNIRFFGHVQTMLLPFIVLPVLWWGRTPALRALLFMVPVLWWMLTIASGTRGSWVGLLIGVVAAVAFGGRTGVQWLRWQIGALIGGAVCYVVFILWVPGLFAQPTALMHRGADIISLRGRDVIWQICQELIAQYPWLGIGPMHYANRLSDLAAHPHNMVLQLMVEWGIPAALLLSIVFAFGGLAYARHIRRLTALHVPDRNSMMMVALLAAITGAAAQAMVDGNVVMPVSQILLALLCGWAMGSALSAAPAIPASVRRSGVAFKCFVLIAASGLAYGVAPELGHLAERERAHLVSHHPGPNPRLLPRFWLQGWIGE